MVEPVAEARPNGSGVAVLLRELRQKRENAFARARAAVESPRFRGLVLEIAAWIESGDWTRNANDLACRLRERPVAAAAAEELRRRRKSILKRGKRLDELDSQRRHRLRIQAKKLRYAAEFFAGAFPSKKSQRRRENFVADLEKLQDALGDLNDIAVHESLSAQLVNNKSSRWQAASRPCHEGIRCRPLGRPRGGAHRPDAQGGGGGLCGILQSEAVLGVNECCHL